MCTLERKKYKLILWTLYPDVINLAHQGLRWIITISMYAFKIRYVPIKSINAYISNYLSSKYSLFSILFANFFSSLVWIINTTKWNETQKYDSTMFSALLKIYSVCLCEQWVEKWRKWKEKSITTNCGGQSYTVHAHLQHNHHTNDARIRVNFIRICKNTHTVYSSLLHSYSQSHSHLLHCAITVPWSV